MVQWKTCTTAVVAAVVCLLTNSTGTAEPPNAIADAVRGRMRDYERLSADEIRAGKNDFWLERAMEGQTFAFELCRDENNVSKFAESYVAEFGKHGPIADMAWALTCFDSIPLYDVPVSPPELGTAARALPNAMTLRIRLCEFEVRRFLREKEARARYWRLAAWHGSGISPEVYRLDSVARHVEKGLNADERKYDWWWARLYLLLAHATSRDDLLDNVEPTTLLRSFPSWKKWFAEHQRSLVWNAKECRWNLPTEPPSSNGALGKQVAEVRLPFADWDESIPPPGFVVFDAWAVLDKSLVSPPKR